MIRIDLFMTLRFAVSAGRVACWTEASLSSGGATAHLVRVLGFLSDSSKLSMDGGLSLTVLDLAEMWEVRVSVF